MLSQALYLYQASMHNSPMCTDSFSVPERAISCANWQSMSCLISYSHKLHFYYEQLLTYNATCPLCLAVGHSLHQLQQTLLGFSSTTCAEAIPLHQALIHLTATLLACCDRCDDDVALLFFLCCKHMQIDAVLGKGKVAHFLIEYFSLPNCKQTLCNYFPEENWEDKQPALHRAQHYLLSSYSKKGYPHLLPLIKENFLALQNWNS